MADPFLQMLITAVPCSSSGLPPLCVLASCVQLATKPRDAGERWVLLTRRTRPSVPAMQFDESLELPLRSECGGVLPRSRSFNLCASSAVGFREKMHVLK